MKKQKGIASLIGAAIVGVSVIVGMISEHYFEKKNNPVNRIAKCVRQEFSNKIVDDCDDKD